MRDPMIGDWNNTFDNVVIKDIDILDNDLSVGNTIVATEWFAELCFSNWWAVNPDWLAAQTPELDPELAPDPGLPTATT